MNVLLITGGSSGIGKATARLFAEKGWHVYELSRHGEDSDGIIHLTCDVTDAVSCHDAVEQVLNIEDHIDTVISNAGFGISGPIEFTASEDVRHLFDVNFFGALNICQAVLPQLRKQKASASLSLVFW